MSYSMHPWEIEFQNKLRNRNLINFSKINSNVPLCSPVMDRRDPNIKDNQIVFFKKKEKTLFGEKSYWHYTLYNRNGKYIKTPNNKKSRKITDKNLIKKLDRYAEKKKIFIMPIHSKRFRIMKKYPY